MAATAAAAFSTTARLLATLLLLALSLVVWKWLQRPAPAPAADSMAATPISSAKKRSKKKPKKKSKKPADGRAETTTETTTETKTVTAKDEEKDEEDDYVDASDDDSDSDDGRPASKVLATRRFKPAALGGAKASVTPTGPRFELDQRVFARFQGGADWFPAVVTEVRRGNLYHLRYEDGETEFHVAAAMIRADDPSQESKVVPSEPGASTQLDPNELSASDAPSRQDGEDGSSDAGDADEGDEDDGWHVVSRTKSAKTTSEAPEGEKLVDGLTKRQRENRRKKERQREIKEMARLQAQSGEFDARARMKYVPPPTSAGQ